MTLFGKKKSGQPYPKTGKKPLTGVKLPEKKSSGIVKSVLFGSNDNSEESLVFKQPERTDTIAIGRELIRVNDEILEKLGRPSGTDFDTNPELNSRYTRLLQNSNIPARLFTPEVESYLMDRSNHDLNKVLRNVTKTKERNVSSFFWMKDYHNPNPSVFGKDTNPNL